MSDRTPNLADIIRQAIEDRLAEVHVMLPGRIDSYDASLQKADVEPLIRRLQSTVDGEINEELPVIPGVPVVFPRAGGFKLTMPVEAGDRCMLVFCERSIDVYQTGDTRRGDDTSLIKQTDPGTFEMHNLSDPVAIMGWYNDVEALSPAPDSDDMVIGKHGGAVIHISDNAINLFEKNAAQPVALAGKVLDELQLVKSDLAAFKAAYDAHIHITTATVSAGPLGVISPTVTSAPTPHDPQSVAASQVRAT